jgi:hypothetical protein
MILQHFRNFMWNGAVMHVLRRAALEVDEKERRKHTNPGPNYGTPQTLDKAVGTPASIVQKYGYPRSLPGQPHLLIFSLSLTKSTLNSSVIVGSRRGILVSSQ